MAVRKKLIDNEKSRSHWWLFDCHRSWARNIKIAAAFANWLAPEQFQFNLFLWVILYVLHSASYFRLLLSPTFYVFLFTFFRCHSFSLLVAANFPPFFLRRYIYKIVLFFLQRNRSPRFLPFTLALSLLSTSMLTLILSWSKESALLLFFFVSKSLGRYAIYRQNARVLEMQNFISAYMKGWTYVWWRTPVRMIFSEPNFLWCSPARNSRSRKLRCYY